MSAPRKFDEETRARVVRMYWDRIAQNGDSKIEARWQVVNASLNELGVKGSSDASMLCQVVWVGCFRGF